MLVYSILIKIPVFRVIMLIINLYVVDGDPKGLVLFGGWSRWIKKLWFRIFISLAFSVVMVKFSLKDQVGKVDDISLAIFPNLIGFGIGAYALLFVLSKPLFSNLKSELEISSGFSLVNANFAFPLLAIIFVMFASFVSKMLGSPCDIMSMFVFGYGMLMLLDIVGVVFSSAIQSTDDFDEV